MGLVLVRGQKQGELAKLSFRVRVSDQSGFFGGNVDIKRVYCILKWGAELLEYAIPSAPAALSLVLWCKVVNACLVLTCVREAIIHQ